MPNDPDTDPRSAAPAGDSPRPSPAPGKNTPTDWDAWLHEHLRALPQPEVSSNFTARTLRALQRDLDERPFRAAGLIPRWLDWRPWISPALSLGLIVLLAAVIYWWPTHRHHQQMAQTARDLAHLSRQIELIHPLATGQAIPIQEPPLPKTQLADSLQLMRDYQAIASLPLLPAHADADLLAALE